jgi:hypothetical protein
MMPAPRGALIRESNGRNAKLHGNPGWRDLLAKEDFSRGSGWKRKQTRGFCGPGRSKPSIQLQQCHLDLE